MSDMVEVVIDSIRVSLLNQQRIVILREVDQDRYLAIWVGIYEAEHLTVALQDVKHSRPLTYDLFDSVIKSLEKKLKKTDTLSFEREKKK